MSLPFRQRLTSLLFLKPAHCFGSWDALRDELREGLGFSFKSVVDLNQQEPSTRLRYLYLSIHAVLYFCFTKCQRKVGWLLLQDYTS